MKSLKRTLCLVLALVMVLGLFGIASATDFTDDNTIQYKEAVEVVTGIGAINGMGDGTFNPKGTITRAQAATMVTRVALTAGVAADLTGISSSFTDVTTEGGFGWAIPSIEYMVKEGIINGMGDGTFNPNGEINGYAVLKMLLCVLGYGKQDEYIGHQWTLQVAVDANTNGLTDGRAKGSPALSEPATREEVALYCFNALGAEVVAYDRLLDRYEKSTTPSTYDSNKKTTLADDVYGVKVAEGVVTKNGAIDADAAKAGTTQIDTYTGASVAIATPTFAINTGLDLVGHWVKVYYKDTYTSASNPGTAYAVVDASTIVNVEKDITTNTAAVAALFGTTALTEKNATIDSDRRYGYVFDGSYDSTGSSAVSAAIVTTKLDQTTGTASKGTYIIYKGAVVSYIAPATYTTSAVTAYEAPTSATEGKLTIGVSTTITIPKVGETNEAKLAAYARYNIYEAPAKDDIVIIQQTGDFTTITKANVVGMGTISEVNITAGTFVSNGTTYTKGTFIGDGIITASGGKLNALAATLAGNGSTYAFLADAKGDIVAIATVDSSADKGIVYPVRAYQEQASASYGSAVYLNKIQCVDMDGNMVVYTVGATGDDSTTGTNASAGVAMNVAMGYCYEEINSSTGAYQGGTNSAKLYKVTTAYNETLKMDIATLTAIVPTGTTLMAPAVQTSPDNKTGKIVATDTNENLYFDDNTRFVFVKGGGADIEITALTGNQVIPASAKYTYYATLSAAGANTGTVNYIVVNDKPVAAPVTSGIMYVKGGFGVTDAVEYTTASGRPATAYRNYAFVDGELTAVVMTSADGASIKDSGGTNAVAEGFYKFTVDSQGLYSLTPYTGVTGVTVKKASDELFVSSVFTSGSKQVLSTAKIVNGAYGTSGDNIDLDDADMTGIKIVDVLYETAADKTGMTNHNTLALIKDGQVAYTYTTGTDGAKNINGVIYYVGSSKTLSVTIEKAAFAVFELNSGSSSWTDTTNGGQLTATATASDGTTLSGESYAWSIVSAPTSAAQATSDGGAISEVTQTIQLTAASSSASGTITGKGTYVIKCVVTAEGYLAGENTITLEITQAEAAAAS